MTIKRLFKPGLWLVFLTVPWAGGALGPSWAGTLSFSKPERLATLQWSNSSNHGVPTSGPEWLMVDPQGRFLLGWDRDFVLFSSRGDYLQDFHPIDTAANFYGFTSMETSPSGDISLLARSESPLEQWGKDNFEERTKPGARLIVLSSDGKVKLDKEEVDVKQPHSHYLLKDGVVYSVHDDGSYDTLDFLDSGSAKDPLFGGFAPLAYSSQRWQDHLAHLPVFNAENKSYHDVNGNLHEVKGGLSYLMGHLYVEGTGVLAGRNGKIYYQVVCDQNRDFVNAVFVEDLKAKNYGLIVLVSADPDLDIVHHHTVFVDKRGDVYEGVAEKEGYRIYEWKALR